METTTTAGPSAGPPARWTRLRWHALALLALLLVGLPFLDRAAAIPDEAVYSAQARLLAGGSWSGERPAVDLDPDATMNPLLDSKIVGDRYFPYTRHAIYPLILTPAWAALGPAGLLVVSALGTWAAALVAALIAGRLDRRIVLPTLWLVGLGSPLLFDATVVLPQSLAAAACGLTMLGVARIIDQQDRGAWVWLPLATAAMVMLRSEGVIVAAAMAVSVVLAGCSLQRKRLAAPRTWAAAIVLAATGAAAYLLDGFIGRSIGSSGGVGIDVGGVPARGDGSVASATWASLLRPFDQTWSYAGYLRPLIFVAVLVAAVAHRLVPRRTLLPLALLICAAGMAIVQATQTPSLINGLLPAVPLLPLGLLLLRRVHFSDPLGRRLALTALLATPVLLLTIYADGGASQWGGRFFHILLPLLLPLSILAVWDAGSRLVRGEARVAGAAVAIITLALSTVGVRWNHETRDIVGTVRQESVSYALAAMPDERPLLVIALLELDARSRFFWRDLDRVDVLCLQRFQQLSNLLAQIETTDRTTLTVLTDLDVKLFRNIARRQPGHLRNWRISDGVETDFGALLTLERTDVD